MEGNLQKVFKMRNPIREYSWGSKTALARLLGLANKRHVPQAELWMGSHADSPSQILTEGGPLALDRYIRQDPRRVLGSTDYEALGPQLPFLFKVLAAQTALSIQAHPNREQAAVGYAREEAAGITRGSTQRNYRDINHKPELICALSDFHALKGLRPYAEIAALLRAGRFGRVSAFFRPLNTAYDAFRAELSLQHLGSLLRGLLQCPPQVAGQLVSAAVAGLRNSPLPPHLADWIRILHRQFPGDIGVLFPLFLNLIRLQPGEALFLEAGELHTYLKGSGLELMANSDNVLRGGLTSKHVDVDELLRIADLAPRPPLILKPLSVSAYEQNYPVTVREFSLSCLRLSGRAELELRPKGAEILLVVQGRCSLSYGTAVVNCRRGESLFIRADVGDFHLSGRGVIYRAASGTI